LLMDSRLRTPVVLIIFNRPERTREVFAEIRAAQPSELFIIADGPRPNVASDVAKCAAARATIERIDWPCQITRRYSDSNIGLRRNVSVGLDWVFSQTERAIILEDDCLPDPSFFPFCEELLERYAEDRHVGMIGGTNLDSTGNIPPDEASYYFSRFCHIWGWATWRRAWQICDQEMKEWPELRRTDWLKRQCANPSAENFWRRHFDDSAMPRKDSLNTWDVPWLFTCWRHSLLAIIPRTNLVTNLGFGREATHTKGQSRAARLPTTPMHFPLRHPKEKIVNAAADRHTQDDFFEGITPWQRLYWKLRLPLPIWLVRRAMRCLGH
jgi:hypothetical protein